MKSAQTERAPRPDFGDGGAMPRPRRTRRRLASSGNEARTARARADFSGDRLHRFA